MITYATQNTRNSIHLYLISDKLFVCDVWFIRFTRNRNHFRKIDLLQILLVLNNAINKTHQHPIIFIIIRVIWYRFDLNRARKSHYLNYSIWWFIRIILVLKTHSLVVSAPRLKNSIGKVVSRFESTWCPYKIFFIIKHYQFYVCKWLLGRKQTQKVNRKSPKAYFISNFQVSNKNDQ